MKKKGDTPRRKRFSFDNKRSFSEESETDPAEGGEDSASGKASVEQQTYDEKLNAWLTWGGEHLLRSISIEFQQVSVIISGVGSEIVKKARKPYSPREANLIFSRIPRRRRALTVVGADAISLSFSPDAQCNALFCFVGLHAKVGDPVASAAGSAADEIAYTWHTVAHPFHLVAEVKGILPFIIWAVNYDHYWNAKKLGLNLSSTEIAVSLSTDHLHTALLHLDDYTDPMSSYNEWIVWLKEAHCQKTFDISEQEKTAYRDNYARIKGVTTVGAEIPNNVTQLTLSQMKDMERRMTRYEIMSLRCFAMTKANYWRIPKANKDFEQFLEHSRSLIGEKGDESLLAEVDAPTPFQQQFLSPLHALATLIREKSSIFAPHVSVECLVQTLHIDFPQVSREMSSISSIPSSITVSGVSFDIDQESILFLGAGSVELDATRPFLNLSLGICAVKWDVVDTSTGEELPLFRDRTLVGMVYMVSLFV